MTAPSCRRCRHRHVPALPCWGGRYAQRLTRLVLSTYGDRCIHCGEPGARTADHLVPRSAGGLDSLENLRPAHLVCNISRGVRPMPAPVQLETSPRW